MLGLMHELDPQITVPNLKIYYIYLFNSLCVCTHVHSCLGACVKVRFQLARVSLLLGFKLRLSRLDSKHPSLLSHLASHLPLPEAVSGSSAWYYIV